MTDLTPREIVSELDRYIIGQKDAKRAVAVALRNRWRRKQLADDIRDEVYPKNILMIGPTGVGKTEISRRLAKLANARPLSRSKRRSSQKSAMSGAMWNRSSAIWSKRRSCRPATTKREDVKAAKRTRGCRRPGNRSAWSVKMHATPRVRCFRKKLKSGELDEPND